MQYVIICQEALKRDSNPATVATGMSGPECWGFDTLEDAQREQKEMSQFCDGEHVIVLVHGTKHWN